jgi:hypothetical protein
MRSVLIRSRLGIDTGWTDSSDRFCGVVGSEAAGKDNRDTGEVNDAANDTPVVRDAGRADQSVCRPIAVEKQKVCNANVAAGNRGTFLPEHRYTSHYDDPGQYAFERSNIFRGEQLGAGSQVDDRGVEFARPRRDQGDVAGPETVLRTLMAGQSPRRYRKPPRSAVHAEIGRLQRARRHDRHRWLPRVRILS